MPRGKRLQSGVTLMELMVVVAIVGILAAIAYPAYTQFVMQTNRTDATKTMQLYAQSLERCYSNTFDYTNNCNVLGAPVAVGPNILNSPNGYYSINVNIADPQDYTITATPQAAPQTNDVQCWTFVLSSSGQQTAQDQSLNPNTQTCWGSN